MFAFSARHLTRQAPSGATDNRQGREPLLQGNLKQLAPSGRQNVNQVYYLSPLMGLIILDTALKQGLRFAPPPVYFLPSSNGLIAAPLHSNHTKGLARKAAR